MVIEPVGSGKDSEDDDDIVVDGKVEVSWTQGTLQATEGIGETWTDIKGATSPYQVEATGGGAVD